MGAIHRLFTIKALILTICIGGISQFSFAQFYSFDPSDASTYDTDPSCSNITGSFWRVSNDSCSLATNPIQVPATCGGEVPVTVRINQSGNLGANDYAIIEYKCSNTWFRADSVSGVDVITDGTPTTKGGPGNTNNVIELSYSIDAKCAVGQTLTVRVIYVNDHPTEKWYLFKGDIDVGSCTETVLNYNPQILDAKACGNELCLNLKTSGGDNIKYIVWEKSEEGKAFYPFNKSPVDQFIFGEENFKINDKFPLHADHYRATVWTSSGNKVHSNVIENPLHLEKDRVKWLHLSGNEPVLEIGRGQQETMLIIVLNSAGQEVFYESINVQEDETIQVKIPLKHLDAGIYFTQVRTGNFTYSDKLHLINGIH